MGQVWADFVYMRINFVRRMVYFGIVEANQVVNPFCPQKNLDIFARDIASFQASGSTQPVCHAHQRSAKMRVVKDISKGNGGRPFIVYSKGNNPCLFWQWGDVVESPKPILTKVAYFTVVPTK